MFTKDLSFIQNLFEDEKMKLHIEVTFYTYQTTSFSFVATCKRDVLDVGNTSKERYIWKGKCETMEKKCSSFQKELVDLYGKIKLVKALQEEEKVYGFPSTFYAWIIDLNTSLKVEKSRHQETFNVTNRTDQFADEAQKYLQ